MNPTDRSAAPEEPTRYERLVAAGKVRQPARGREVDLRTIRRVTLPVPSAEVIADLRGDEAADPREGAS